MPTAAIYARFSTDRQDRTSIEDQVRSCRSWIEARGLALGPVYSDEATSGSIPVAARSGGGAMHAAALAGAFAVLVLEGLDRLSRDTVDGEAVLRRLEHRGVRVVGIADGYDTASGPQRFALRGMRGVVNELYRRDLPPKIKRGQAGAIARGFHAGAVAYGYRSVPVGLTERGEADGFRLEIVPEHAEVVREIFARAARGEGFARIAADLNARGVRGPGRKRGAPSTWSVPALYGAPRAGSGIVNNRLYVGELVWNRREWVRDPDDPGRRTPRMRPASEWQIAARPELRIVDDATWARVRARMDAPAKPNGRGKSGPPPRTLFGGALRCGRCGGAMVAVSATAYGCAARKDRGTAVCAGVRAPREAVDRRLAAVIREAILSPEAIATIQQEVRRILGAARRDADGAAKARRAREAALRGEIGRLVDAVAQVGLSDALRARLATAEAELAGLIGTLAPPPALPSDAEVAREIAAVAFDLERALAGDTDEARSAIAERIGPVIVEDRDGETVARMRLGPALLLAGGADSIRGCGGRIPGIESIRRLLPEVVVPLVMRRAA